MPTIDNNIRKIATEVINKRRDLQTYIDLDNIDFVVMERQKKNTYAEIRKIGFPAELYTDKSFVIFIYPVFFELNSKKQEITILHELLHIEPNDPSKMKKHDVEDFKDIIEEYGINWLQ